MAFGGNMGWAASTRRRRARGVCGRSFSALEGMAQKRSVLVGVRCVGVNGIARKVSWKGGFQLCNAGSRHS